MTRSEMLGRNGWWAIPGYLAIWAASTPYIGLSGASISP
jgi:hypothetical protein